MTARTPSGEVDPDVLLRPPALVHHRADPRSERFTIALTGPTPIHPGTHRTGAALLAAGILWAVAGGTHGGVQQFLRLSQERVGVREHLARVIHGRGPPRGAGLAA